MLWRMQTLISWTKGKMSFQEKGGPGGVSKGAKILSENKKNILLGV